MGLNLPLKESCSKHQSLSQEFADSSHGKVVCLRLAGAIAGDEHQPAIELGVSQNGRPPLSTWVTLALSFWRAPWIEIENHFRGPPNETRPVKWKQT